MADLPFDFTAGRCQGLSQSAVLCSPEQADNKCWELTGSGFTELVHEVFVYGMRRRTQMDTKIPKTHLSRFRSVSNF